MSMAEPKPLQPNNEHKMIIIKPLTKKLRREICQQIIDRCPIGVEMPADDLQVFNEMLGTNFVAAKHMRNPSFPDPRHVHVFDGAIWDECGWNDFISPKTDWRRACDVMRKLSEDLGKEFARNSGETTCAWEYKGGCKGALQSDHKTVSFDAIARAFVDEYGLPELEKGPPGAGRVFKSMEMEAAFIAFHSARADYQLLCARHNQIKGNRSNDHDGGEE